MKVLLATHNQHKLEEFNKIVRSYDLSFISLNDITKVIPIENGSSFEENALLKAKFAAEAVEYNIPTIADDSGLCIKCLNNEPGIYSARWANGNDFNNAFTKIKQKLNKKGLRVNGQKAKFVCVLALINVNKEKYIYKGTLHGTISFPPKGNLGFGYDPIFIPVNGEKTLAQMQMEKKNAISHRYMAIKKLLKNELFIKNK